MPALGGSRHARGAVQGNRAGQVDPKEMWDYGARVGAAQKKSRSPKRGDTAHPQDVARDIRELEDYLKKKSSPNADGAHTGCVRIGAAPTPDHL